MTLQAAVAQYIRDDKKNDHAAIFANSQAKEVWLGAKAHFRVRPSPLYARKQAFEVQQPMSAMGHKGTSGREVRHASFDDVGLVSSHGASKRTETGRRLRWPSW